MNSNLKTGLSMISTDPEALKLFLKIADLEISMPNIPTPTMGGEVFWTTICESHGWRIQQNMLFKNARILRDDNVRIAWGSLNGMIKAFNRFVELQETHNL